jgi:hypothetical protein
VHDNSVRESKLEPILESVVRDALAQKRKEMQNGGVGQERKGVSISALGIPKPTRKSQNNLSVGASNFLHSNVYDKN